MHTRPAAAYGVGLCSNHGFLDGNKRTAYVVAETFLDLNGYEVTASEEPVVRTMLELASSSDARSATDEVVPIFYREFR
jgi:death-on-curing protein